MTMSEMAKHCLSRGSARATTCPFLSILTFIIVVSLFVGELHNLRSIKEEELVFWNPFVIVYTLRCMRSVDVPLPSSRFVLLMQPTSLDDKVAEKSRQLYTFSFLDFYCVFLYLKSWGCKEGHHLLLCIIIHYSVGWLVRWLVPARWNRFSSCAQPVGPCKGRHLSLTNSLAFSLSAIFLLLLFLFSSSSLLLFSIIMFFILLLLFLMLWQ